MHVRLVSFAPILVAFLAYAPLGRAAPSGGLELHWSAPPGCPTTEDVEARAAALRADDALRHSVVASADVSRTESTNASWHLELETTIDGEIGKRSVDAGSCSDVADEVALVLAAALDAPAPTPPPTPSLEKSAPPHADGSISDTPVGATAPTSPSTHPWNVAALLSFDDGVLPGTHDTYTAAVGWTHDWLRLELVGGSTIQRLDSKSTPGTYTLMFAQMRGCYRLWHESFGLDECLGFEAGSLDAKGYRTATTLDGETSRRVPWFALRSALVLTVPIIRRSFMSLSLRGDFDVSLINTNIALAYDDGSSFRTATLPMRFSVGLAYEF